MATLTYEQFVKLQEQDKKADQSNVKYNADNRVYVQNTGNGSKQVTMDTSWDKLNFSEYVELRKAGMTSTNINQLAMQAAQNQMGSGSSGPSSPSYGPSSSASSVSSGPEGFQNMQTDNRTFIQKAMDRIVGNRNEVTNQKTDWGDVLKGVVSKGANEANSQIWSSVDFLNTMSNKFSPLTAAVNTINSILKLSGSDKTVEVPDKLKFGEKFTKWAKEDSAAGKEAAEQKYAKNAVSSRAAQIVDKFGTATVAALPMALAAIATSGASATPMVAGGLAEATPAGLSYIASLNSGNAIGTMSIQGIKAMLSNPNYYTAYLQVVGPSYDDAKASGLSDTDAEIYALTNSALNAMIEIGGADEALGGFQGLVKNAQQTGDKSAILKLGKSAFEEGMEEVKQGIVERGLKATMTPDNGLSGLAEKWWSTDPENTTAVLNPFTAAEEFAGGAVVGALLGGGETAAIEGTRSAVNSIRDSKPYQGDAEALIKTAKENATAEERERIAEIQQDAKERALKKGNNEGYALSVGEARELYQIVQKTGSDEALMNETINNVLLKNVDDYVRSVFNSERFDNRYDLSDDEVAAIAKGRQEGQDLRTYVPAMREAYDYGRSGKSVDTLLQSGSFVQDLLPTQARLAWSLGANVQTAERETADISTPKGRETVQASLAALGTHADAAADVYEKTQDVKTFAAAMNKAVNVYAAAGGDLQKLYQEAKEGRRQDIISYLTPAQIQKAAEIGAQVRQEKLAGDKQAAADFARMREAAKAQIDSENPELTKLNEAIREAREYIEVRQARLKELNEQANELVRENPEAAQSDAVREIGQEAEKISEQIYKTEEYLKQFEAKRKQVRAQHVGRRKKGTISFGGGRIDGKEYAGVDQNNLNRNQKKAVALAQVIADALDIDIVFFTGPEGTLGAWQGDSLFLNMNGAIKANKNGQTLQRFIVGATMSHELTHYLQKYNPEVYRELKDFVTKTILNKNAAALDALVRQQIRMNPKLSYDQALDEIVANACQTMLYNSKAIRQMARQNMTLAEKVADVLEEISNRIRAAFEEVDLDDHNVYQAVKLMEGELDTLQEIWDRGILGTAENYQAAAGQELASIAQMMAAENKDKYFEKDKYYDGQIDQWDKKADGSSIKVGVLKEGSALNRVGFPASSMWFDVGKIKKGLGKHTDHLTRGILKQIPAVLNNPIAITEYKGSQGNATNTVSVYGLILPDGKTPVVVGVMMTRARHGAILINKIRTIHAESGAPITDGNILYLNEDKKRTRKWFQICGIRVPLGGNRFGLIRSITYTDEKSNGGKPAGAKGPDKNTPRTMYQLVDVEPVQPETEGWERTHTTEEALKAYPNLWNVKAEKSEKRNPTQIASTQSTYRNIYRILKNRGFTGKILDASSGLGIGTQLGRDMGFDVDDIEPYPGEGYEPKYTDYSKLNEKYDAIISSAVLNVLPQDQRDALVVKMGELLNPGGVMFITTRGKDVENLGKNGRNIHLGPMEWIETSRGSYQKGFTQAELKAYLQDALGDGFRVEDGTAKNGEKFNNNTNIIVTKEAPAQFQMTADMGYDEAEKIWNSMTDEQKEAEIYTAMTMDQAKTMVQKAFVAGEIRDWYDGEYKNGDEWLKAKGAEEVAMYIDNEYTLQEKYIHRGSPALAHGFVQIEEVLDAYLEGKLTGRVKEKRARADLSKGSGYQDSRFYSNTPAIEVTPELWETANVRANSKNRADVNEARKKILLAAHDGDITKTLGITAAELNKKLRQWSRYSSRAREASIRINSGVAPENRWTGIQNSSILNQISMTDEDIRSMVKEITGESSEYQRNYIGRTMLALDTHIDWSWLTLNFLRGNVDPERRTVMGNYVNSERKINIGGGSGQNTVSHEMGHALDYQWARELFQNSKFGIDNALTDNSYRLDLIPDEEGRAFYNHFREFINELTDVNSNVSSYTMDPKEVFARFVARFVEWTEHIAGAQYYPDTTSMYRSDRFNTGHYLEFAKLLQEKAAWDAKQATEAAQMQQADENQITMEELTGRNMERDSWSPVYRRRIEAAENLAGRVKDYLITHGTDPEELEEFGAAQFVNRNMTGADDALRMISELSDGMTGEERAEAFRMMEELRRYVPGDEFEKYITAEGPRNQSFADWYNDRHPSLYYPGYKPGDLTRTVTTTAGEYESVAQKEKDYLHELLQKDLLPEVRAEAEDFLERLNRPRDYREVFYQQVDDAHNAWAPEFFSKMNQVIEKQMPNKMAANQVIPWLTGKGVKKEEIKWSGIQQFLEGKKTVTKAELQAFLEGNQLNIRTVTLESGNGKGKHRIVSSYYYDELIGEEGTAEEVWDLAENIAAEVAAHEGYDDYHIETESPAGLGATDYILSWTRGNDTGTEFMFSASKGIDPGDTHWIEFKTDGGTNYREILFQLPGFDFNTSANETHWGDNHGNNEAPNYTDTIAHVRIQDTDVIDPETGEVIGRMLFVDELQSDLHNTGSKYGFRGSEYTEEQKEILERSRKAQDEFLDMRFDADDYARKLDELLREKQRSRPEMESYELNHSRINILRWIRGDQDVPLLNYNFSDIEKYLRAFEDITNILQNTEIGQEVSKLARDIRLKEKEVDALVKQKSEFENKVPDAPFSGVADTYHEYAMKHVLRLAAEGGYDYVGWTTADQQVKRWSKKYEKAYRILYDQNIPKFMGKYVKQWGGRVGEVEQAVSDDDYRKVWGVELTNQMKQDVLHVGQPLFQQVDDQYDDTTAEANGRETSYTMMRSQAEILEEMFSGIRELTKSEKKSLADIQARLSIGKDPEVRVSDAKKLAKTLLKNFDSKAGMEETAAKLKYLADYIVQTQDPTMTVIRELASEIAADIVENAQVVDESKTPDDTIVNIANRIAGSNDRPTKFVLQDPSQIHDAGGYETIQEFNKAHLKHRVSVSSPSGKGYLEFPAEYLNIDEFYTELQNDYGKNYFPDVNNEGEQLEILSQLLQASVKEEYVNPYKDYMGEMTGTVTDRIVHELIAQEAVALNPDVMRLDPMTRTERLQARNKELGEKIKALVKENKMSQKEAGKLYGQIAKLNEKLAKAEGKYQALLQSSRERVNQVRAEGRARAAEARIQERQRAAKKIRALKDYYQDMEKRARERRNESEGTAKYRKQIQKKAAALYEMLMSNSDKKHVPEVLKRPVAEFLESIDFTSKRALAGGEETNADRAFGARMRALERALSGQQDYIDGNGEVQADLGGYVDISQENLQFLRDCIQMIDTALKDNRNFTINSMSAAQLKQLSNFLSNLNTAIRNMNSFMANARYESVREAASADIETMRELGKAKAGDNRTSKWFAAWDNGTPYYVFKRFGEGAKAIFDGFTRGWEKMAFNAQQIIQFTEEAYTDKEVNEWKKQIHDITLTDGSKIQMTTAQIMELSMLLGREQALKHIEKGGIRIGDIKVRKGTIQDTAHYHLTPQDITNITGLLTQRQKAVAKKLQNFMAQKGAEWGNEVSMRRFGYKFYTEGEGYYPIRTDSNDRPMADTDAQKNSMFRLLNLSSSKSLNPKASNALVVGDIFDTFSDHMADMAKLNGMGLPILDAIKWFNFKERINHEDGTYDTRTLQGAMQQAFGDRAQHYFRTLMKDINGQTESGDRGISGFGGLLANYKIAAVGANLRVALLQPTSYVRATTVLKPHLLLGIVPSRAAYNRAMKYSGTAVWKSLGYYDTDISKSMRGQIEHADSVKDRIAEGSMKLAELGDQLTWSMLWVACERQARSENRGLKGEALERAAADIFREVVYSSQVMDSTLTRSEIMRAKTIWSKTASAFMAEPTLSYNILLDAYSQYQLDARRYGKASAWVKNVKTFGKAFAVFASSAAFAAVMESLMDAVRDDDDDEFLDKFLEHFLGDGVLDSDKAFWERAKALYGGNLAQDMTILGKLPFVKDFISMLQGYSNQSMMTAWFSETMDAVKILSGNGSKRITPWGKIYKILQPISHLSGLAMSNAARDAVAIWNLTVGSINPEMKLKKYDSIYLSEDALEGYEEYVAKTGITKSQYKRILEAANTDGNTSVKQDEMGAYLVKALEAKEITEEQAQALWKSQWHKEKSKTFDQWRSSSSGGSGETATAENKGAAESKKAVTVPAAPAKITTYDEFKKSASLYSDKKETAYKLWESDVKPLGIDLQHYVDIVNAADKAGDGNGSVKQDEMGAQLVSEMQMGKLNQQQAEAIWHTIWNSPKSKTFAKWYASHG